MLYHNLRPFPLSVSSLAFLACAMEFLLEDRNRSLCKVNLVSSSDGDVIALVDEGRLYGRVLEGSGNYGKWE